MPSLPGPAGAADPVDIGLGHLGQVVVEHVGQLLDVQAPGGDVGGHQHPDRAVLEVGQGRPAGRSGSCCRGWRRR